MNVAIVGYGPAGVIAAISLNRCGHKVTIFEKGTNESIFEIDKSKCYPIDIGAKGLIAIEYIGANKIFEKHCNPFLGILQNTNVMLAKEEKPGFMATRPELMRSL